MHIYQQIDFLIFILSDLFFPVSVRTDTNSYYFICVLNNGMYNISMYEKEKNGNQSHKNYRSYLNNGMHNISTTYHAHLSC